MGACRIFDTINSLTVSARVGSLIPDPHLRLSKKSVIVKIG